jgi:transcriptional regulator with XRE-family HTH domain
VDNLSNTLQDSRYCAIVARLVALRKQADLNQRELAERLSISQSFVAKVELHERRLDVVQLIEWVRALGVDEKKFLVEITNDVPNAKKRRRS